MYQPVVVIQKYSKGVFDMKYCYKCRTPWQGTSTQPAIRETCGNCCANLHSCKNCRFYDERKPQACMVASVDPVLDKERFNFCEEFQFVDRQPQAAANGHRKMDDKEKAREQWKNLFRKPEAGD